MPNPVPAAATGLPATMFHEIRDSFVLGLGAPGRPSFSLSEREARRLIGEA